MQTSPPRMPFVLIPTSAHPASPIAVFTDAKAASLSCAGFFFKKSTAVHVPLQRAPSVVAARFISHRTILHLFLQDYAICIEGRKASF